MTLHTRSLLRRAFACSLLALGAFAASAQDRPSAYRALSGQAGVGFSFAKADYGYSFIKGVSAYGGVDLHQRLGIEADAHVTNIWTPLDIAESSFLIGPRVILLHSSFGGREDFFRPYVKAQAGMGIFQYQ